MNQAGNALPVFPVFSGIRAVRLGVEWAGECRRRPLFSGGYRVDRVGMKIGIHTAGVSGPKERTDADWRPDPLTLRYCDDARIKGKALSSGQGKLSD